jgi:uncharacterized protein YlzI (FlbEa/FlbD family)
LLLIIGGRLRVLKIKCLTKKRTVSIEGKLYVFNLGDVKDLPESAITLAKTQFFEVVQEEIQEEIQKIRETEDDM